jgi:alkanesulfonate monooxygenase SsuD/methylene tetrahydromethanopterin reductase-like flavin-dependent oxidoreductase (luciferase family)
MRFSVWVSSGHSWPDILELSTTVEQQGWDGIWLPDHFMPPAHGYGNEPDLGSDPELDPIHEGWSLLAALAGLVPRVTLGVLVSGLMYRHPAVLAKMAATIDHISGGRSILGIGAGWQENEHRRYGIRFPTPGERSDRLEEAAALIAALTNPPVRSSMEGLHYQLDDAPLEPAPIQQPYPLLIGGGGEIRTIRTAARYATHWNAWGTPETMAHKVTVLRDHCAEADRDPSSISVSTNAFFVRTASVSAGTELYTAMGERGGLVGTNEQIRRRVAEYHSAGVDEIVVAGFNYQPDELPEALTTLREIIT